MGKKENIKDCEIKRRDLKYSFIKELSLQMYHSNLSEREVQNCSEEVKDSLYDLGYICYIEKRIEDEKKLDEYIQYTYSDSKGKSIVFSRYGVEILDKIENYKGMDVYLNEFLLIVKELIKTKRFIPEAVFINKKNLCYVTKLENLEKYFENFVFPEYMFEKQYKFDEFYDSEAMNIWEKDNMDVTFKREITTGEGIDEKSNKKINLYRIILDFGISITDICTLKESLKNLDNYKNTFINMNSLLYETYKNTLKIEFLRNLTESNFKDKDIKGVTKNTIL